MPVSLLDVLKSPAAARSVDSSTKSADGPGAFGPALAEALKPEQPPAKRPATAESSSSTDEAETSYEQERGDSSEPPTAETAAPEERSGEAETLEQADAVEISEEATAAAATEAAASAAGITQESMTIAVGKVAGGDAEGGETEFQPSAAGSGAAESPDSLSEKERLAAAAAAAAAKQQTSTTESDKSAEATGPEETNAALQARKLVAEANSKTKSDGNQLREVSASEPSPDGIESGEASQSPAAEEGPSRGQEDSAKPGARTAKEERTAGVLPSESRSPDVGGMPIDRVAPQLEAAAATDAPLEAGGPNATDAASPNRGNDMASSVLDRLTRTLRAGESASPNDGEPQVDRTRFLQRVEGAVRTAQQRDGRVQVRLSPPELGNLRIELAVQNGVMTAKLEAETPAARNALLDSLPALRERLAQQDIRIEKFDVDVRRDGQNMGGNGGTLEQRDQHADRPPGDRHAARLRNATRTVDSTTSQAGAGAHSVASNSGLDVRI